MNPDQLAELHRRLEQSTLEMRVWEQINWNLSYFPLSSFIGNVLVFTFVGIVLTFALRQIFCIAGAMRPVTARQFFLGAGIACVFAAFWAAGWAHHFHYTGAEHYNNWVVQWLKGPCALLGFAGAIIGMFILPSRRTGTAEPVQAA